MKGILIVNGFLNTPKFQDLYLMFKESAKKNSIHLSIRTNDEILVDINQNRDQANNKLIAKTDFVLFWDKDIRLATYLENLGLRVFNSAKSIAICDDKSITHLALMNSGIRMPRTIVSPMAYSNIAYSNYSYLEKVKELLDFPIIVKEVYGSFGSQVYMANNEDELKSIVKEHKETTLIFQEYIKTSKGRDVRIQVVGGKVIAGMYRYNDTGDFRANLSNGGHMKVHLPTKQEADVSIEACKILGLDFAGVDILFGEDEEPILCEVNSNAHFKNITEVSGISVADSIIEHIVEDVKNTKTGIF